MLYSQGLNYLYYPSNNQSAANVRYLEAEGTFETIAIDIPERFDQVITITNRDNNLVGYTNGRFVWNREGNIIPNGDSLGWTKSWEIYQASAQAIFKNETVNTAIVLPTTNDSLWLLLYQDYISYYDVDNFHLPWLLEADRFELFFYSSTLYMAKIRLMKDGQLVILATERDIPILEDFMIYKSLMAVSHANGEDWWVIAPCQHEDTAYSIMVSDTNVTVKGKHFFSPNNSKHLWFGWGTSRFSYSGEKIARINYKWFNTRFLPEKYFTQYIEIMGFDRCTGKVTEHLALDSFPRPNGFGAKMDALFSRDDRYLYISEQYSLVRKDLSDGYPLLSKLDTIRKFNRNPSTWEEFYSFDDFSVLNYLPDGRIWMAPFSWTPHFHLLEYPEANDSQDVGYMSRYYTLIEDPLNPGVPLNARYSHTWHTFKSPSIDCEGVTTRDISNDKTLNVRLYPNPVMDLLYLDTDTSNYNIQIVHMATGRVVHNFIYYGQGIDVSHLHPGMYSLHINGQATKFIKH